MGETIKINIRPLSVNAAWKGQRFKTKAYKKYEEDVLFLLNNIKLKLPDPPFKVYITFGFSSKGSDIDNPTKMFLDILQKKYNFNDSLIYELILKKVIVNKKEEFIKFSIETVDLF